MSYLRTVYGRRLIAAAAFCVASVAATPALAATVNRFGSRDLSLGMSGHDVMWLQRDLTDVGFPTRVTAYFSAQTQHEVKALQGKYRLGADGVVGPKTFTEIYTLLRAADNKADAGAAAATSSTAGATNSTASAASTSQTIPADDSGGTGFVPAPDNSPVEAATLNSEGLAVAPEDAPTVIKEVIAAANAIAFKPYIYGGGHASFNASGYDCSGSVSYALHGGNLLASPLDSTQFESYGDPGPGRWITIYADDGHAYMDVAGLWFDTAAQSAANGNDRWSATRISTPQDGNWVEIHPAGW